MTLLLYGRLTVFIKNRATFPLLLRKSGIFYIEQPEGYSVGKTVELAQEIEDGENIVSETDKSESEESVDNTAADTSETVTPKNIILIMNESLTDFENVGEIKSNVEILPYIRSLNKNVKHGQLHVPTFGAGTARSEYEALTGNSMSFLPSGSVPYQALCAGSGVWSGRYPEIPGILHNCHASQQGS